MPLVLADRVRETTTTTGTGTVSLAGAVSGFQGFSTAIGNGNTTYYTIVDAATGAWEVGLGTYTSSGSTLSRDTVLSSSNSGNLVPFAAGVKDVFVTQPAERAVYVLGAGTGLAAGAAAFTANGVPYADSTSTLATSANLTFNGTTLTAANFADSSLTSGRVTYATTNGNLTDSANLTFDGTTLTANALTTTSTVTLSGGTANGVAYLNASKVLTTGSALVFDGTNLGVGTSSPSSFTGYTTVSVNNATNGGIYNILVNGTETARLQAYSGIFNVAAKGAATNLTFETNGSERMRLDTSGNLGIGTSSPAYKLDVSAAGTTVSSAFRSDQSEMWMMLKDSGTTLGHVRLGSASGAMLFYSGNSTRATLDSSGNLGLGVTPSAWASQPAIQQTGGAIWGVNSANYEVLQNAFYNGTNYIYRNTNLASRYNQNAGVHSWYTAPSGTAGNAITFTQAMTLSASGNLGVGTTNPQRLLHLNGTVGSMRLEGSSVGGYIEIIGPSNTNYIGTPAAISSGSTTDLAFFLSGAERARITSGGDLLVGTTTSKGKITVQGQIAVGQTGAASSAAGIYIYANDTLSDNSYLSRVSNGGGTTTWYIGNQTITTSSDQRLKSDIKPTQRNALELLSQWEIVDHTWNDPSDQCENNRNSRGIWTGVVAQQVQPITPWLVNKPTVDVNEDGSVNPWTMDFGYAVPLLVKAIQEQQALITSLTARIAALEAK